MAEVVIDKIQDILAQYDPEDTGYLPLTCIEDELVPFYEEKGVHENLDAVQAELQVLRRSDDVSKEEFIALAMTMFRDDNENEDANHADRESIYESNSLMGFNDALRQQYHDVSMNSESNYETIAQILVDEQDDSGEKKFKRGMSMRTAKDVAKKIRKQQGFSEEDVITEEQYIELFNDTYDDNGNKVKLPKFVENKLQALQECIHELRDFLDEERQISDDLQVRLETEKRDLQLMIDENHGGIDDLIKQLDAERTKTSRLFQQLRDAEQSIKAQKDELNSAEQSRSEQSPTKDNTKHISELTVQVEILESDREALKRSLEEETMKLQSKDENLKAIEDEKKELMYKIDILNGELVKQLEESKLVESQLQSENLNLKDAIGTADCNLEDMKINAARLQEEIKRIANIAAEVKGEEKSEPTSDDYVTMLRGVGNDLMVECDSLKGRHARLEQDLAKELDIKAELKNSLQKASSDRDDAVQERDGLRSKLASMQTELEVLDRRLKDAGVSENHLRNSDESDEDELPDLPPDADNDDDSSLTAAIAAEKRARNEANDWQRMTVGLQRELEQLRSSLREAQDQARKSSDIYSIEKANMETQINDLGAEMDKLSKSLALSDEHVSISSSESQKLREQLGIVTASKKQIELDNDELKKDLDSLRSKLKISDDALSSTNVKLTETTSSLASSSKLLDEATKRIKALQEEIVDLNGASDAQAARLVAVGKELDAVKSENAALMGQLESKDGTINMDGAPVDEELMKILRHSQAQTRFMLKENKNLREQLDVFLKNCKCTVSAGYAEALAAQPGYSEALAPQTGYSEALAPQTGYSEALAPQAGYSEALDPPSAKKDADGDRIKDAILKQTSSLAEKHGYLDLLKVLTDQFGADTVKKHTVDIQREMMKMSKQEKSSIRRKIHIRPKRWRRQRAAESDANAVQSPPPAIPQRTESLRITPSARAKLDKQVVVRKPADPLPKPPIRTRLLPESEVIKDEAHTSVVKANPRCEVRATKDWLEEERRKKGVGQTDGHEWPWFHGLISRAASEKLLAPMPPWSFLIRVSESRFGFALSLRGNSQKKAFYHFYIEQNKRGQYGIQARDLNDRGRFFIRDPLCDTLEELVVYFRQEEIKLGVGKLGRAAAVETSSTA